MPAISSSSAHARGTTAPRRGVQHYLAMLVVLCLTASFFGLTAGAAEAADVAPDPTPTASPSTTDAPNPLADGDRSPYLVTFADGTTASQRTSLLSDAAAADVTEIPQVGIASASLTSAGVDALRADAAVVRVEADAVRAVQGTPDDPAYDGQWALPKIGWDQAYGSVDPAGHATVAVLDTGVDVTDDLAGHVLDGASMLEGVTGTADPNGHGTAMAEIVAAGVDNGTGIAGVGYKGVSVMPVKVLGADGTGQDSDIVAGVVYAADHGADVILMSFANPGRSSALQAAVDYAWSKGAVLVAATGNDGSTTATYPAGLGKVVGVSATTRDDALWTGSNSGDDAFLGAPGVDIAAGGGSITGTSASAAVVAGSAALLKADHPDVSNDVLIGRLARTADPAGSISDTGNGRVNLARALADDSTGGVTPQGVAGSGGPVVGPYLAASNANVSGVVTDKATGQPINGATVTCPITECNATYQTTTNTSGAYTLAVTYGGGTAPRLNASAPGYTTGTTQVQLAKGGGNSDLADFALVASTASTTTTLTSSGSPSTYGSDPALTATVSPSPAGAGTVTFRDGTATLCNAVPVSGNAATCTPAKLAAGSHSITAQYSGASGFAASTSVSLTQVVNRKPVTGSFTALNKEYDRTNAASVGNRTVDGVLTGDTVSLTGGTATFDTSAAGTGKTVTGTGFSLSGASAVNYVLNSGSLTAKADITAKTVTGSFTVADKVYDGTNSALVVTRMLAGVLQGDTVSLAGGTASFGTRDVGTAKTVTLSGAILAGADAGNYQLGSVDTFEAAILPKIVSGSFNAADKAYDGNASATIVTRALEGAISSDWVSLTGGSATFEDRTVGTDKTVTGTGFALSGNDKGNYTLASDTLRTTAAITQLQVTGSFSAADKTYDGTDTATITDRSLSGVLPGDSVTLTGGSASFGTKDAGTGKTVTGTKFQLAGPDSGNYSLASTTLIAHASITQRAVEVTADAQSKIYGEDDPLLSYEVTAGSLAYGDAFTGRLDRVPGQGVGDYAITQGTLALNDNYALTFKGAQLTITKATLQVTADAQSKTYGEADPALTYQVTKGALVGDDKLSGTLDRVAGSATGSYAITQGTLTAGENYALDFVGAKLTIAKKALSITAKNQSKTYGVGLDLGTTEFTVGAGDLETGDTVTGVTLASEGAVATANVREGGYPIVASDATGSGLGNYDISYHDGTLSVTKRTLVLKADDKSKLYGAENPGFTGSISGVQNDDVVTLSFTTTADTTSPVGSYPIMPLANGTEAVLANYAVDAHDATLRVTPASLTITAADKTKVYGADNPTLTGTVTGVENGDAVSGSFTTAADKTNGVGGYPIVAHVEGTDAALANYDVTLVNGTLTVTRAPLTVTAADKSKVYGADNPTLTGTVTGIQNGDQVAGSFITAADQTNGVGSYTIAAHVEGTDAALANYDVTLVNGTLTVTKAPLTITADADDLFPGVQEFTKTYGAANPTFTVSYAGFVNGDTSASLGGTLAFDTDATASSPVGAYDVMPKGLTSGNYDITFVKGTLSVTKKALTVTAVDSTKVYGAANPTFTVSYGGFVNGDTAASPGGTLAFDTDATASSPVGAYDVTPKGLTSGNYDISFVKGTLSVIKKALAVTAVDSSKVYGAENPAFTVSYGGFVNGDTAASLGGTLAFDTDATASSPVGKYDVTPKDLTSRNYAITFVKGTLTVIYGWDGFLQPINDTAHQTGVLESKFKLGQTIPVKFDLKNAAGQVVTQTGNPTFTRSAYRGSCDSTTSAESVPLVTPDAAAVFTYTSGHYQYNWSTKGISQAGEYRIFANVADGTTPYVDICLTK